MKELETRDSFINIIKSNMEKINSIKNGKIKVEKTPKEESKENTKEYVMAKMSRYYSKQRDNNHKKVVKFKTKAFDIIADQRRKSIKELVDAKAQRDNETVIKYQRSKNVVALCVKMSAAKVSKIGIVTDKKTYYYPTALSIIKENVLTEAVETSNPDLNHNLYFSRPFFKDETDISSAITDNLEKYRENIGKIHKGVVRNYSYHLDKSNYIDKNMIANKKELASYYVLTGYLDKGYSPALSSKQPQYRYMDLNLAIKDFDPNKAKQEIDQLSKNPVFVVVTDVYKNKSFTEWKKLEKESDDLFAEYDKGLKLMGGSTGDLNNFVEYAMNLRTLFDDQLAFDSSNKLSQTSELSLRDQVAHSICDNVSKILALKLLTDPKNRFLLNGAALDLRSGKDRFKDLSERFSNYLKSKNMFSYGPGLNDSQKCFDDIKNMLRDPKSMVLMKKVFAKSQLASIAPSNDISQPVFNKNLINPSENKKANKAAILPR
ncbi:MAG: hypothetical protein K5656_01070 [Lachnospiraceae bacterium]|nr:hypothetical protein [Lachnospiraceae bacterium]